MNTIIQNKIIFTTRDLELLPDSSNKYEIIEGDLYMTRAPHWKHQRVIGNICTFLNTWCMKTQLGFTIINPGIIFSDTDNVIPDLVWISKERLTVSVDDSGHLTNAPELIIEVLSDSKKDIERDKDTKLKLYSTRGVQEYWIVNWRLEEIEIYRRNEAQLILKETKLVNDQIISPLLPEFICCVKDIFQ